MCDPILGGTTMAVMGFGANYFAAKQQGLADQGVAKYNARVQENEATRTRNAGTEQENDYRKQINQKIARQRAQAASLGVDVNSGGVLALQEGTRDIGESDALRIRRNTDEQVQALQDQSDLTLLQGKNARKLARLRGITSGISGGLSLGSSAYGILK